MGVAAFMSNYQKTYFVLSVADVKQLPSDQGLEVAIVGRSNAGKSSVLNRLTHIKQLARVSKTPGRTQLINIFAVDDKRRLVDLPGYGFAKVSVQMRNYWQKLVDSYLKDRKSLKGIVLIMDIRHPLKPLDLQLLDYCQDLGLPVHILLNKADKISKQAAVKTLKQVELALTHYGNSVSVQIFSALKGAGIEDLHYTLNQWLGFL